MPPVSDENDYEPSEVESRPESARDESDVEPYDQEQPPSRHISDDDFIISSPPSPTPSTSYKRQAQHLHPYAGAPLKRQRRTFNPNYLALLNEDIADAAVAIIASDVLDLKPSQIGAVRWTAFEKEAFFSALGRLGRDDLPGIATRVGSKSTLEVRQFLMLLDERTKKRREDVELRRKTLKLAQIPAAAELSHECTVALEEAADDLALRQENHEVAAEETRWGDRWLVTRQLSEEVGSKEGDEQMPFVELFHVRAWLKLSERIFMNSVIPEYNWRYVSEEPPAVRATAFSDLHSLAVSITKRLVVSTIFMAGMRIKAQREYMPSTKNLIKSRDVQAAMDSLNMKRNSHEFWARAPRRLRLHILQDEVDPDRDDTDHGDSQEDPMMSYDDIEAALGVGRASNMETSLMDDNASGTSDTDDGRDDDSDLSILEDDEIAEETGEEGDTNIDATLDEEAIKKDMREAMYFSADYEFTTRARQGLQGRIEAEHRMEEDAEGQDIQSSREEEARLWSVLRKSEPVEHLTPDEGTKELWVRTVGLEPAPKDWKDSLEYVSEWEMR